MKRLLTRDEAQIAGIILYDTVNLNSLLRWAQDKYIQRREVVGEIQEFEDYLPVSQNWLRQKINSFSWASTPQGNDFWMRIYDGNTWDIREQWVPLFVETFGRNEDSKVLADIDATYEDDCV